MTSRFVVINEFNQVPSATPFATHSEALTALRTSLTEAMADPDSGIDQGYVEDCLGCPFEEAGDLQLELAELGILVVPEGSEGVWIGFDSADRCTIGGSFPEDEPWGSGDDRLYRTVGVADGTPVTEATVV